MFDRLFLAVALVTIVGVGITLGADDGPIYLVGEISVTRAAALGFRPIRLPPTIPSRGNHRMESGRG